LLAGEATTAIVAVPDFVVSWILVAVTVTLLVISGATYAPFRSIVPALADQFTSELKLPVPVTCTEHFVDCASSTVTGEQETATELTELTGGGSGGLLIPFPPPPHPVKTNCVTKKIAKTEIRPMLDRMNFPKPPRGLRLSDLPRRAQ
jgi:hypothetical protein